MSRSARRGALAALVAGALLLATGGASATPPAGGALAALAEPAPSPSLASDRIYFVMTDRYANGDPANDTGGATGPRGVTGYDPSSPGWWHGGDLKGLTGGCTDPVHGLQRVAGLGFNAIWITPVVVNQVSQGDSGGYHGYWGTDFTRVDPHLGSDADFAEFVACAHRLGLKVILDVVVNHTGDIIQLTGGSGYETSPYRDCHGKRFDPAAWVGKRTFPCLSAATMPRRPIVVKGLERVKKPDWLNDVTNYHDRGDINFDSCSQACYEQGDLFGLDDLFTENPKVEQGLAQLWGDWIAKYKLDGFRVDTARHVNAGFFGLWVPQVERAASAAGVDGFQIFGEVPLTDSVELSSFVRKRGLPSVLDFPFQSAAAGYASGGSSAVAIRHRLEDDDYYRRADGADPAFVTFLGNHDMGRAALQVQREGGGLGGEALLHHLELGYDLLYLLRGAPVVYYGDEVGMLGDGGDKAARQDMFPTQVEEWQTQQRVGSPPIGTGSSFAVTTHPLEIELQRLAALRSAHPALATGWSTVRYAKGGVLVVSRVDPATKVEYLVAFDNGDSDATVTVGTSTPGATWTPLLGGAAVQSDAKGRVGLSVPAVGAVAFQAQTPLEDKAPPKPTLALGADELSSLWVASATVGGSQPVSVAFALRKVGSSKWRRLDVDTSPPFRGFLDPARFPPGERLQVVAVARSLDGRTASSRPIVFRIRRR